MSTRKAGTTAECPRCQATVIIPLAEEEADAAKESERDALADSFLVAEPMAIAPETAIMIEPPPRAEEVPPKVPTTDARPVVPSPPIAVALPRAEHSELHPKAGDFVVVPRYVLYAQGALLAAVALASLVIGVLLGRSFSPRPMTDGKPRDCAVSGSVTYQTGARTRPDRGAVIVLIPLTADAAGERAIVAGLRPSDPPPAADHPGLGVIRQLGGAYTRADANGRFEVRIPANRYWRLVISHNKRAPSTADESAIRMLSRYFEDAADFVEDREYQWSQQAIGGDEQWEIEFAHQTR